MKKLIIIIFSLFVLSSCAGYMHVTVPQSCITYSGIDFEVGRYVEHSFTKVYIFGLGGLRHENVIKELMTKANLQTNETLGYINVTKNTTTFFGIFSSVNFVASGYVVKPTDVNN